MTMKQARMMIATLVFATAAFAATQTKTIQYEDTSIKNASGMYRLLPDGSYEITCCGEVRRPDGSLIKVDEACTKGTAATLAAAMTACIGVWRSTNGY